MSNYTIKGTGSSAESAQNSLAKELTETNKKLAKNGAPLLEDTASSEYSLLCGVKATIAPGFSSKLQGTFSGKNFDEALKRAKKDYGKIEFSVKQYSIAQVYALSGEQDKVLAPSRTTPAGSYVKDSSDLSRLI